MNDTKVSFSELSKGLARKNFSNFPVLDALEEFWDGDSDSFKAYLGENGFDLQRAGSIQTLDEVINFSNYVFIFFEKQAKKAKLGNLDYRLATVLKPRFLTDFRIEDMETISLDISSFENKEAKKVIKEAFKKAKTGAFIDYKEIVDDTLFYTYNRKGLIFDSGKFSIAGAKKGRIALAENYKSPKDNNFISARLITEMSKIMVERGLEEATFSQIIITPNGEFEKNISTKNIIKESLMSQEDREELKEAEKIKIAAKQELKDEKNLTRTSLNPDSNIEQINKTAPEVRINSSYAVKINYNDENFLEEVFAKYEAIQYEAMKQRLLSARENGHKAYASLKANISNGMPIYESLNIIKQEYRDDEIVRFASFLLTKDLLDLSKTENEIISLKEEIAESNAVNDNLSLELAKKDTTIKELQANFTRKSNEMNLLKEKFNDEIEIMKQEAKSTIDGIRAGYDEKLKEANAIIDDQEKIILKLQPYEEIVKNIESQNKELNAKFEKMKEENITLSLKEKFLNDKINELSRALEESKKTQSKLNDMIANIATSKTDKEEKDNRAIKEPRVREILKQYEK